MNQLDDVIEHVQIAQSALEAANHRRQVALDAVTEYALRAVMDGGDVEQIAEACGFAEHGQSVGGFAALFGFDGGGPRRARFGQWLGQALCERIMRDGGGGTEGQVAGSGDDSV